VSERRGRSAGIDVAILDYGMGNLRSVQKAFEVVGARARLVGSPPALGAADAVVLPGVGAFARCMENLGAARLDTVVRDWVGAGRPFLGICLGEQLLFEHSAEGDAEGLGLLPGAVRLLRAGPRCKVPHMGWNVVAPRPGSRLLTEPTRYYFVHSYYVEPADPTQTTGTTTHGIEFASAVEFPGGAAVQFHPEKSGAHGLALLARFLDAYVLAPSPVA